jgi:hypothetical protein
MGGLPKQQFDTGFQTIVTDIRDRRMWVADTERQLVFGFAKPFTFQVAEVFNVREGKIEQIEACLFSTPNYRERTDLDQFYEARGFVPNNGT